MGDNVWCVISNGLWGVAGGGRRALAKLVVYSNTNQ